MRASFFAVLAFVAFAFAAPITVTNRGFLGDLAKGKGPLGKLAGAIGNPKLTISRLQVVKNLATTQKSLDKIGAQADATGNAGVTTLVADAQEGLSAAKAGVGRIGKAIITGGDVSKDDQKDVAVGIKGVQTALDAMSAAITTPDADLSTAVDGGIENAGKLEKGGEGVLEASGLSFADLGLPDDFATSA